MVVERRGRFMRLSATVVFLSLLFPSGVLSAQQPDSAWDLRVVGAMSFLKHESSADHGWHPSIRTGATLVYADLLRAELGITLATIPEWGLSCPDDESCNIRQTVDRSLTTTTMGIGVQVPHGRWVPYLGIGGGWTRNEYLGQNSTRRTWVVFSGTEYSFTNRISGVADFRVNRENQHSDSVTLHYVLGAGISVQLW
jgi:hypothetical protein